MQKKNFPFLNRDLSWLEFNERVLEEAESQQVPILEKLKFLAIFSSNLEEFYRVRVASLNRLSVVNDSSKRLLGFNPKKTLKAIKERVFELEQRFEIVFHDLVFNELYKQNIQILGRAQTRLYANSLKANFNDLIKPQLKPLFLEPDVDFPHLKDKAFYLFVHLTKAVDKSKKYVLIELPDNMQRFYQVPNNKEKTIIALLEDIVVQNIDSLFVGYNYKKSRAFVFQLIRDAEINLGKIVGSSYIEELSKEIDQRKKGRPMRLLYDSQMPFEMLQYLVKKLKINTNALMPSNRYLRFGDFVKFPKVADAKLYDPEHQPLLLKSLDKGAATLLKQVQNKDILFHFPYQTFDYVVSFFEDSARLTEVKEIYITLYRLAENSKIIEALALAAKKGKKVYCILELKARFDETANIYWANYLRAAGVNVLVGISGYKIHAKMALVRVEQNGTDYYCANLSTGNYNEQTAAVYADCSLFTANTLLCKAVKSFFLALLNQQLPQSSPVLLLSPNGIRQKWDELIDREIEHAKNGEVAYLIFKVNSLSDEAMIAKLYEASCAGVKVSLIVRGICCLVPGQLDFSENIEVISIVDRYLEHSRVFIFGNKGDEQIYLSTADLMNRNLDNRVEIAFPVFDDDARNQIRTVINFQLQDNLKARHRPPRESITKQQHRAQLQTYYFLKDNY